MGGGEKLTLPMVLYTTPSGSLYSLYIFYIPDIPVHISVDVHFKK